MADAHVHVWMPPKRTHVGWYVTCKDHVPGESTGTCDAWFSSPTEAPPTRVPVWMEATVGTAVVVPTPMQVLDQKVADGVIYPQNVPSNTIDARPPKEAGRG